MSKHVPTDTDPRAQPLAESKFEADRRLSTRDIVEAWLDWIRFWRPRGRRIRLQVVGVEVIQAIQHFDLAQPQQNNSVPLVARKRTMARVYIDWERPDGVRRGLLANVTGTVKVSSGEDGNPALPSSVTPINTNQVIAARPHDQIDRRDLNQTLNFVLPVEPLTGWIQLEVDVRVKGIFGLLVAGDRDSSTVIEFHERRLPKKLVYMLARNGAAPWPTVFDYYRCLLQVVARFPAPDADFSGLYYPAGHETIENHDDLSSSLSPLVSQLEPILGGLPPDRILAVLLSAPAPLVQVGTGVPGTPVVFMDQDEFPHELSHYFGLGHSVGDPNGGSDPRGIPTSTDDLGMDMNWLAVVPQNTAETMVYLASARTWCSTTSWQLLYDAFAP
jgi:hypothetical protein